MPLSHTDLWTALMPHSLSNVELSPIDSAKLLPKSRDTRDQTIPPTEEIAIYAVHSDGLHDSFRQSYAPQFPPEILAYIFELYVASLNGVPLRGLLYLSQVCTHWRAIAESDPRLWTSIHVCFPESRAGRKEDVQRVKPIFDLHLKRSGALPISLTFIDHRAYHTDTKALVSLLVDQLRTNARRWRRLSLQLAGGYFPSLFKFTPCDLSSLEYLCINGNSFMYASSTTLQLNLKSATNLKSFSYNGPGPSIVDNIDLPWQSLADVSFEFAPHYGASFTSYRRFIDLAHCQNITTCSLGIDRPPPSRTGRNITLPYLETLRVRRLTPYAHASRAIHPLILPRLRTLEIDTSNLLTRSQRWHDRTFSDLLGRSGCTLLHLSIRDVDFPNDELLRCLALSPALTSLRFIPSPRSQDLTDVVRWLDVSRLVREPDEVGRRGVALPKLRDVTLASSVEAYLEPMLAMLRSRVGARARAAGIAPLRRAEVVFFDMWHDTEVDRIRGLGDRSERVANIQTDLTRWVSENRDEDGKEKGDEAGLDASLVVDSPYLPGYIDFDECVH